MEEKPIPREVSGPEVLETIQTNFPMTNAALLAREGEPAILVATLATSGQLLRVERGGAYHLLELERGVLNGLYPVGNTGLLTLESTGTRALVIGLDGEGELEERAAIEVGRSPRVAEVVKGGREAWVLARGEDEPLVRVDLVGHKVVARASAGETPVDMELDPGGEFLYVANFKSNDVSVLAVDGAAVQVNIPVGRSPSRLFSGPAAGEGVVEGDRIYVLHANAPLLTAIDTQRRLRETWRELDAIPSKLAVSADGRYIYALSPGAGKLMVVDAEDLAVRTSYEVPVGSSDILRVGDSGLRQWLLISTAERGQLLVFRVEGANLKQRGTLALGAAAGRVASTGPDDVWMIGPRTGRVGRFRIE